MEKRTTLRFKKIYSFFLGISFILSSYVFTFFKYISLDYLIYSIMSLLLIFYLIKKEIKIDMKPVALVFFLFLMNLLVCIQNFNYNIINSSSIIGIIKLFTWCIILSLSISFVEKKTFFKVIYFVAMISTLYLIIQSLFFYLASVRLPNVFNFGIITYDTINSIELSSSYRPCAFFNEPAYYASYVLCVLSFLFLDRDIVNYLKPSKYAIALLSVGILLSASTAGIYLYLLLLVFYLLKEYRKTNLKKTIILLFLILITSVCMIYYEPILKHMGSLGNTLLVSINKVNNYSNSGRIGKSYDYLKLIDNNRLLFGYGIGNEYEVLNGEIHYMNTLTRTILQHGIIGTTLIIEFILNLLLKSKKYVSRYLLLLIIVKCLTGNMLFNSAGIYFFSVVLLNNYQYLQKGGKNNDKSITYCTNNE